MAHAVVEFCGLPGSGKTTVAGHTREQIERCGVECDIADVGISAVVPLRSRVTRRTAMATHQVARHPLASVSAIRTIFASDQVSMRDAVAGIPQWLAVRDLVAAMRASPGVHLVEEGLVQRLWTLALRARRDPSPALLRSLSSARIYTDLVVVLDVPVALATARLAERPSRHSRTQRLPDSQLTSELARGQELLERLLTAVPASVLRLDAGAASSASELGRMAARSTLAVDGGLDPDSPAGERDERTGAQ
jgi:predicted kinase